MTAPFPSPPPFPGPLVTLDELKAQLNVLDPAQDEAITALGLRASLTIWVFLKALADATWNETTTPGDVKQAVLLLAGHWWEHRGEEMGPWDHQVWDAIARILVRRRDPALA